METVQRQSWRGFKPSTGQPLLHFSPTGLPPTSAAQTEPAILRKALPETAWGNQTPGPGNFQLMAGTQVNPGHKESTLPNSLQEGSSLSRAPHTCKCVKSLGCCEERSGEGN